MPEVSTSRRDVMCALAIVPAVIAVPAAGQTFTCAPDFDAAEWIRGFIALGGSVYLTAQGPHFGYPPDEEISDYVKAIGRHPERWSAVKARVASIAGRA